MNTELIEDEMRRALFGDPEPSAPAIHPNAQDTVSDVVIVQPVKAAKKKKSLKRLHAQAESHATGGK